MERLYGVKMNTNNTMQARIGFNKAMQEQYAPSQQEYSKLAKAINEMVKAHGPGDVAVSAIENALAHAYMCGQGEQK